MQHMAGKLHISSIVLDEGRRAKAASKHRQALILIRLTEAQIMRIVSPGLCFLVHLNCTYKFLKSKNALTSVFFVSLLGILMAIGGSKTASAQDATQGWCAAYGPSGHTCVFYGSAEAACAADREAFNPKAADQGIEQTGSWSVVKCRWCQYNSDGYGCYGIGAPTVFFTCSSGFDAVPPGQCVESNAPKNPPAPDCTAAGGQSTPRTAHPIIISTGHKTYTYNDFSSPGKRIDLTRIYSNLRGEGSQYVRDIGFDQNWLYDFQMELVLPGDTRAQSYALHLPNGFVANFGVDSSKKFVPADSNSVNYQISLLSADPGDDIYYYGNNKSRWKVTDPTGTIWVLESFSGDFGQNGEISYRQARPISRTKSTGQTTTFKYSTPGQLLSLQDEFGNIINFTWYYQIRRDWQKYDNTYNVPAAVKSATLPDGSSVNYSYDSISSATPDRPDRLTKFERRNGGGTVVDAQIYGYTDSRWPLFITTVTDNRGVAVSNVAYDDKGRVVSSSLADGLDQSTVSYGTAQSDGTITRTVTNALGKQTVYTYRQSGGTWRYESSTGVASTSCPASVTSQTYDTNSFVLSETDEEGRKTTYVRDSMGRPTSITRGAQ